MSAAVSCLPAGEAFASGAPKEGAAAEWSCAACSETFTSAAELRAHCKSERHVYNTKRRLAGLKPMSLEAWERKLRERGAGAAPSKGTAHLKAKKPSERGSTEGSEQSHAQQTAKEAENVEWTPTHSLFDRRNFRTVDENLAYMRKNYDFIVPDQEYCTDVPGLLTFLWRKISEPPYACLYCNRKFVDASSVKQHMIEKKHTRIGTEARSRRGYINKSGTQEMREELEDFYDYHGSTREITEQIRNPEQKVAALLRFFDVDRDGLLRYQELAALWAATTDRELAEVHYRGACKQVGADPDDGVDVEALGKLYRSGLADLDEHFAVLQDLLAKKLRPASDTTDENGEEESEGADGSDEEEEEEDGSSSGTEVVECEDEDEFEEVMRVLGLRPATILDNGDLQLPNGTVAAHRDVAHIWRQRGHHFGQAAVAPNGGRYTKTPLMLSNISSRCDQIAMTRRQRACEGKRVMAVLRNQQKSALRLGLQQSGLPGTKARKVRTVYGDASGGR